MPMDAKRYPSDWEKIATKKKKAVVWKCEACPAHKWCSMYEEEET